LTLLVYEVHYPGILQVEASNPASAFPFNIVDDIKQRIRHILRTIVTLHPKRQRLHFADWHYTVVARYFMHIYLGIRSVFNMDPFISDTNT